jgi:hypothetical protein
MSALLIAVAEHCRYCHQQKLPSDMMSVGTARCCHACFDRTQAAWRFFGGHAPPPECQGCGASFLDLSDASANGDTEVCLRWKDGVIQVLCSTCSRAYESKRKDFYSGTQYGHRLNKE